MSADNQPHQQSTSSQQIPVHSQGTLLLLGLVALAGGLIAWFYTPWGVKVGYDSQFYLSASQNFLKGLGLGRIMPDGSFIPLVHFPPLYPLFVSIFQSFKPDDLMMPARWAAIVLYMLGIFLSGFTIYRFTHSKWAAALAAFIYLISPIILDVSLAAFSEGLYFIIMILSLLAFNQMLADLDWKWIVLGGFLAALGSLTRYVGITLAMLGIVGIWLLSGPSICGISWRKKLSSSLVFGTISIIPLMAWYLRNWLMTRSLSNREPGVHIPDIQAYRQALETMTSWFLPDLIPLLYRLVIFAMILVFFVALLLFGIRKISQVKSRADNLRFIALNVLYIPIYFILLWLSRAFMDSSTRWETRILSPLWINLFFIGFLVTWNFLQVQKPGEAQENQRLENDSSRKTNLPLRVFFTSAILVLILYYGVLSFRFLSQMRTEGSGFASPRWENSQTIRELKQLPEEAVIYTNDAAAIYFLLGRAAYWIPERYDSVKDTVRQDYESNLASMRQALNNPAAYLVIFLPYRYQDVFPALKELTDGLEVFFDAPDGQIYWQADKVQNEVTP